MVLDVRLRAFFLAWYFIFIGIVLPAAPRPAVAITVEHGPFLPANATVRLKVTIAPNAQNVGLWTAIEADGYATAHYEEIAGQAAPVTRWVEFKDVPDGEYTAWARLLKQHGGQSASAPFTVGTTESDPFP